MSEQKMKYSDFLALSCEERQKIPFAIRYKLWVEDNRINTGNNLSWRVEQSVNLMSYIDPRVADAALNKGSEYFLSYKIEEMEIEQRLTFSKKTKDAVWEKDAKGTNRQVSAAIFDEALMHTAKCQISIFDMLNPNTQPFVSIDYGTDGARFDKTAVKKAVGDAKKRACVIFGVNTISYELPKFELPSGYEKSYHTIIPMLNKICKEIGTAMEEGDFDSPPRIKIQSEYEGNINFFVIPNPVTGEEICVNAKTGDIFEKKQKAIQTVAPPAPVVQVQQVAPKAPAETFVNPQAIVDYKIGLKFSSAGAANQIQKMLAESKKALPATIQYCKLAVSAYLDNEQPLPANIRFLKTNSAPIYCVSVSKNLTDKQIYIGVKFGEDEKKSETLFVEIAYELFEKTLFGEQHYYEF